jgi:SAM-dependent methyltransferase
VESLTDTDFWDEYWSKVSLPVEVRHGQTLYLDEILNVFDRFLPHTEGASVLEIGGAPGQYVAYVCQGTGADPHVLDVSPIGCHMTSENFRLLGISGAVHLGDMFDDTLSLSLPKFDIVFSLGLMEHFSDLEGVVERHLRLLKPGGILMLGCPNFLGVNGIFLRRMMPDLYSVHNMVNMDLRRWRRFEKKFGLIPAFRGYVGGFEPRLFARTEHMTSRSHQTVARASRYLARTLNKKPLAFQRKFNSRYWSGYVLGVYTYPAGIHADTDGSKLP